MVGVIKGAFQYRGDSSVAGRVSFLSTRIFEIPAATHPTAHRLEALRLAEPAVKRGLAL